MELPFWGVQVSWFPELSQKIYRSSDEYLFYDWFKSWFFLQLNEGFFIIAIRATWRVWWRRIGATRRADNLNHSLRNVLVVHWENQYLFRRCRRFIAVCFRFFSNLLLGRRYSFPLQIRIGLFRKGLLPQFRQWDLIIWFESRGTGSRRCNIPHNRFSFLGCFVKSMIKEIDFLHSEVFQGCDLLKVPLP